MTTTSASLTDPQVVDAAEAEAFRDMYAAAPDAFRHAAGLRCLEAGGATLLVAPGIPSTMFNRVIGLGVFREAREADVDAVIEASRAAGCPKPWIHVNPAAQPARLAAWLEARGYRLAKRRAWAKMLYDPAMASAPATTLAIREVGPGHAQPLAAALVTAFEMPPSFNAWFESFVGRPNWHAVAGFDGDTLVCGGLVYCGESGAWLGVGGTLPACRGRGGQSAVIAERVRIALAGGIRRIVTETGEPVADEANPSLKNLRRAGFRVVCSRLNYEAG